MMPPRSGTHLKAQGWPRSDRGRLGGNGHHLVYAIDLPNDAVSRDLVKAMLGSPGSIAVPARPRLRSTTTVFNASRIVKLYGTAARKGDATADRPHRISRVLQDPRRVPRRSPSKLMRGPRRSEPATDADADPRSRGRSGPTPGRDSGDRTTPEGAGTTIPKS